MDENQDGKLSKEEVIQGLKICLDLDWKKIEVDSDELWENWDYNSDNFINLEELIEE